MPKRKTLPKDFSDMLKTASLDELKAVFDKTLIDARGGYSKETAIGFLDCPDDLIVWLVERGLDVDTADTYGGTPLWERAASGRVEQIPLLLSLGADIQAPRRFSGSPLHGAAGRHHPGPVRVLLEHGANAVAPNDESATPLLHGLRRTQPAYITGMARVAELLLGAGDRVSEVMRAEVARIGTDFEFHRQGYNPDYLNETDAGLADLYRLFDVTPVPRRHMHDGVTLITVPAGHRPDQHQALWELLVPSTGAAATVQGEVIRITGRIAHEVVDSGGVNWDRDFQRMLAALPAHLASGTPLPADQLAEAIRLTQSLRSGDGAGEQVGRLGELAITWIQINPTPAELPPVNYRR